MFRRRWVSWGAIAPSLGSHAYAYLLAPQDEYSDMPYHPNVKLIEEYCKAHELGVEGLYDAEHLANTPFAQRPIGNDLLTIFSQRHYESDLVLGIFSDLDRNWMVALWLIHLMERSGVTVHLAVQLTPRDVANSGVMTYQEATQALRAGLIKGEKDYSGHWQLDQRSLLDHLARSRGLGALLTGIGSLGELLDFKGEPASDFPLGRTQARADNHAGLQARVRG